MQTAIKRVAPGFTVLILLASLGVLSSPAAAVTAYITNEKGN